MRAFFSTNGNEVGADFLRRCRRVDPGQQAANQEIRDLLNRASTEAIDQDIYSIPEKRGPTGRPLWQRTGAMRRLERWVVRGRAVTYTNSAPHAQHRYDYGRTRPARPPQRRWRGPRRVLGEQLAQIRRIRLRHFRDSLRGR